MRTYFFGNMYLSSIQQGIQALHVLGRMHQKYGNKSHTLLGQMEILDEWEANHETVICLNGGPAEALHAIYEEFENLDNPYPFAKFHESGAALDAALTSVGIVLPENIYNTAAEVRASRGKRSINAVDRFNQYGEWTNAEGESLTFTKWQVWLINELNNYGLAR